MKPISPYHAPGFFADALAKNRHRDIVGGRWEETGLVQMQLLLAAGLDPHHKLLDIGAGSLRLGCRAVPYLDPGHYWATDLSGALLLRGYEAEIADKTRLSPSQLIEDADFDLPGIPEDIDFAICFAVFTHLPLAHLQSALPKLRAKLPRLQRLLFTFFLAPETGYDAPHRQPDGVVTHPDRFPYHHRAEDVLAAARAAGFAPTLSDPYLPRGQRLCLCLPDSLPP
jgi:hypothetical protein